MSNAVSNVRQGGESAFSQSEYAERISRARANLQAAGIDVMVVTGPENIFYLTGQQTPGYYTFQALVLPVDGEPVFVIRQLEYFNFISNTFISDAAIYTDGDDPVNFLVDMIQKKGWGGRRVAIDKRGWFLPIAVYEALQSKLGKLYDGAGTIEQLRAIKSPAEVAKLEQAARYVDAGMRAGLAAVKAGASENDFVAAMLHASISAGSEYMGMEPLVSCGPRSGIPHGTWRRRKVAEGEPAFLEMAAVHDRYHAALMRSAWVGKPPQQAIDMEKACQEALQAALDALKPGEPCEAAHLACQAVIDRAGYTDAFKKRTGYSVGISFAPDWGEGSILSLYTGVKTELRPGMAFHIPPALRIYGQFTVGVSETVVVTETGCRVLGTLERPMLVV
ncbi:M24 family metallopeptidase [Pseudomonas typographi]|uniref:Aminopeptidase P family protein n=1 Tax=Pseudomonas typographi TaxID=2715964 RepID=A0ABR7Z462_9PSED|nr:Xaa-Pro peptidase family protein [Pseudomonas typographi]MBD1552944.1 aminopeptidase P family protein [Pseudomonas typographi]MBD1588319.1 aminopeptidase P family protein [Pseudomonas typographi]MBD1600290.1 aminopeptidase P family protein [Pseudomonas typographi]